MRTRYAHIYLLALAAMAGSAWGQSAQVEALQAEINAYVPFGGLADHGGEDFAAQVVDDIQSASEEDREAAFEHLNTFIFSVEEYLEKTPRERLFHRNAVRLFALTGEAGRALADEQLQTILNDYPNQLDIQVGWALTEEGIENERIRRALFNLRFTILQTFGELGDDVIVTSAIRILADAEPASQGLAVSKYLKPLIEKKPEVLKELEIAYVNSASKAFRNPKLEALIREARNNAESTDKDE